MKTWLQPVVALLSASWLVSVWAADTSRQAGPAFQPAQVKRWIADFEARSSGASARRMTKYLLDGQPLWFIPSPCCDQFNYLYDAEGVAVCAPSGGIAGQGNGQCPAGISLAPAPAPASAPVR